MPVGGRIPVTDDPNVGSLLIGRTVATFRFFSVKGSTGGLYKYDTINHKSVRAATFTFNYSIF